MYSECTFKGTNIQAVAHLLGVEREWILGFLSALCNKYKNDVNRVCKRKTVKGQHCKDGKEMGKLFKLAYLPSEFFQFNFATTNEELFNSHDWHALEECKTFMSIGMNYDSSIKKCSKCFMYGGINKSYVYENIDIHYLNEEWDTYKLNYKAVINLTCEEMIIKKLLS